MAVDSGAAETVIPHKLVTSYEITKEGTLRSMTIQAAPVAKPLGSVKGMCTSGRRVFDDEGSYIQNKATGETNWLREEHGNYVLDIWASPSDEAGFGGQP